MNYRLTCLTPTLVGDGQKLSPIDYMVWKDHVNVLDQWRIFRLLAKGPRLEGYLTQLKKADKLDFASWGGFAQNYAGRRIPFEHPSSTQYWERTHAEHLFIPTFSTGPSGPYLAGHRHQRRVSHRRGAWTVHRALVDRSRRAHRFGRPHAAPSGHLGGRVRARTTPAPISLRVISAFDSKTVPDTTFKIFLLRVSTLESHGGGKLELAWKQIPRGSVKRAEDSTPIFAEMAAPGTVFEGEWREKPRHRERLDAAAIFGLVNGYAEQVLKIQKQYCDITGLGLLKSTLDQLETRLGELRALGHACMLPLGWAAGFLSKTAYLNTQDENYRKILGQVGFYARAIQSGLPFPKTRKIVFLGNQPATLAGFVQLQILES